MVESILIPIFRTLNIPFGSSKFADVAAQVLSVDNELQQSMIQRSISTHNSELIVAFTSPSLKMLRTSVSSFFDMASLVARTIAEFGDDTETMIQPRA
ncbi:tRNA processing [Batrachochytrium dendrobatidis]|nr:tRNA processing [Batrachochytrium dendrobatidis]